MMVKHNLEDGWFDAVDIDGLYQAVNSFLREHGVDASVERSDSGVEVVYPDVHDIDAAEDERIVVMFCQSGRFGKAEKVVKELIAKRPWDANAYRLQAQILMEKKDFEKAIEICRDALKFSPKDRFSLILLGNLLSRDKDELDAGEKIYRRVMKLYPDDAIAVQNFAACLVRRGSQDQEVIDLLNKAIELDPHSLVSYYTLTHVYIRRMEPWSVFNTAQEGLRKGFWRPENREPLQEFLLDTVKKVAPTLCSQGVDQETRKWVDSVAETYGVPISVEADEALEVPIKIELAENHQRQEHIIKYSPAKAGVHLNHLMCMTLEKHLMHLEARKAGSEKRLCSGAAELEAFKDWTKSYVTDKVRGNFNGFSDSTYSFLHKGLIGQLYNVVRDLVAEERLYRKLPKLRPAQFMSVMNLASGIVKSGLIGEKGLFPRNVVRATRTMGHLNLLAYRDIVGVDMRNDQMATPEERKVAAGFYDRLKQLIAEYSPEAEWSLVESIARELHLDKCCRIIPDDDVHDRIQVAANIEQMLADRDEAHAEKSNETFLENLKNQPAIGMSVMWFMVDAIRRLREMPEEKVRAIAFQLATLGINGIHPGTKSGYKIPALPNKDMSGCMALAWYYVSWNMAVPQGAEMLEKSMPFKDQYDMALKMVDSGMGK